jgi:hypothetical protein
MLGHLKILLNKKELLLPLWFKKKNLKDTISRKLKLRKNEGYERRSAGND